MNCLFRLTVFTDFTEASSEENTLMQDYVSMCSGYYFWCHG